MYRQIVVSDVWEEDDPYDSRSAFLYILSQAYFTQGFYRGLKVERGQFPTSERELSQIFKWSRKKVHRFLTTLSAKGTIKFEQNRNHRTTLITVTNFDTFQGVKEPQKNQSGTSEEPVKNQSGTSEEPQYKNNITQNTESRKDISAFAGEPNEPPIGSPEWLKLHYDD